MGKGKDVDAGSGGASGTFEDPHKLSFSIKDLGASSVVLYPDQAQITRDIENVQLKPGVNEVTIKDLTGHCQEHSIKVEGKGDAIITDMVVESVWRERHGSGRGLFGQKRFADSDSDADSHSSESESESEIDPDEDTDFAGIRKIDDEIKAIRAQAQDAAEQYQNADVQLQALERYGTTITAEVASPEVMTQFLDAYQQSRRILYEQHRSAKNTIEKLEKALKKKEHEKTKKLRGYNANKTKVAKEKAKEKAKKYEKKREKQTQRDAEKKLRPGNSYRVKVMVETNSESDASLTLTYLVHKASWYPRYDLRLDSIANTGQIVYRAHFENKTYETWRDAKITFSSSAQTFGGLKEIVPTLTAWTLSLQKGGFAQVGHEDHTAGLYSVKEQQELAKRGVTFNNNNKKGAFNAPQQQMLQQQQQMMQQAQMAQQQQQQQQQFQKNANPFGPAQGLFGQANNAYIGGASTLGDIPHGAPTGFGGPPPPPRPGAPGEYQLDGANPQSEKPPLDGEGGDDGDGSSTLAPSRAAMLIAESSSSESYGMTTTYDIAGLKTIKSSPLVRRQVISTIDLPVVTFTSIAVVKLRAAAFLKARFKNSSKHTFLRGLAGLTVDGSFLGQTTIPHCPPEDTISLSLGVDTGVHVSYAKPTLVSSSQGFISKENVTLYKRSIFIHNAKSQKLTLTVLDQVPISEDERLRVNVVSPKGLKEGGEAIKTGAPGSANLDNKWGTASAVMKTAGNGEITYTVKLEKGRSCKLALEYEVKLPAGEKIVGLT
ncbi:hypothetical protein ABW20_dc0103261 [Dactylellina cionopaga]|nr:hypothetical protein ABW20_dc0103261 [Dactylellina cionopaga]